MSDLRQHSVLFLCVWRCVLQGKSGNHKGRRLWGTVAVCCHATATGPCQSTLLLYCNTLPPDQATCWCVMTHCRFKGSSHFWDVVHIASACHQAPSEPIGCISNAPPSHLPLSSVCAISDHLPVECLSATIVISCACCLTVQLFVSVVQCLVLDFMESCHCQKSWLWVLLTASKASKGVSRRALIFNTPWSSLL